MEDDIDTGSAQEMTAAMASNEVDHAKACPNKSKGMSAESAVESFTMTSAWRPAEHSQVVLDHPNASPRHPPSPNDSVHRSRKQKSKKKREERYEEEMQYNLAYNFRGASRRHAQSSRTRDETEYPPPPTYESATAVSTLVSEDFVHQGGPPHPALASPALTVASLPLPGTLPHSAMSDRSDTVSIDTASLSLLQRPSEEDGSSIELVDLEPSERWELDRLRGIPLEQRLMRHKMRTEGTVPSQLPIPQRARLTSQPTVSRGPGSQARFLASQLSLRIPESRDRYEDDRNQDNSDLSTPPTPKHHRMPSIPGSPARFFHHHGRSQSPQPSSSVISLLRNPSPFFKSTPSLLNLSPSHHGNFHRTKTKLFHRKSKERASSEPLEDWEMLERTASGESSVDGSLPPPSPPVTPQKPVKRQLPKAGGPDVFTSGSTKLPADRARKVNTVQIPQTVGPEMNRPASPPFVARHVRRHTTSSRGGQTAPSSAPVSPISVSSASTFSTSTISLSSNTIASEDVPAALQALSTRENSPEPRMTPRLASRSYEPSYTPRTPRVSSPAPSPSTFEHDPDLPIVPNPPYGALPTRSATERIVRAPEARDENHALVRGRSLSRDLGMRSAPAYSTIFPSGQPDMTQSLPPPSSHHPSPRRHYPGRPLPATPPMSPSLTWILDKGMKPVQVPVPVSHPHPHPKVVVSAAPSTPPIPEGLLIDLDDESLDTPLQPAPKAIAPLQMDFLGLEDHNDYDHRRENDNGSENGDGDEDGDDNDDASDSGTVSPPGPLTPTTSAYGSASASSSSLTLSTSANRSVEYFSTPTQTTPTSESGLVVPLSVSASTDINNLSGLVSSLGEQGMADGSNYDALLLIADLLGPGTPPPANNHLCSSAPHDLSANHDDDEDGEGDEDEEEGDGDGDEGDGDDGRGTTPPPSYLVGRVELLRRRVTRDGRVKLKLALMGVTVEKCAICMTQFRDGDRSILGGRCQHAFHEKCLENWLDRSQACPLCRERLDACE